MPTLKNYAISLAGLALALALCSPSLALAGDKPSLDMEKRLGKVALIDFWASWCLPCRKSFPWMWEMRSKYGPKGFEVITVNLDKDAALAGAFLGEFPGLDLPVIMDPQAVLAREWKVEAMPTSFLVDRKGKIRYTHRGFISGEAGEYEKRIMELIGE